MVGGTLRDIRAEIRSLSCPDGNYEVVCGRSGIAPSVVAGLTFPDRTTAGDAAELACTYHDALRRYDPSIPFDDPLVHEVSPTTIPPLAMPPDNPQTRFSLFCHDVSGAVFESLSALGHRDVESAAMETYLTLAEVVGDESDYCLTMVWSLMSEMDVRLPPAEQTAVVERAAEMFAPIETPNPVDATLRYLESVDFLDSYSARALSDEGRNRGDDARTIEDTGATEADSGHPYWEFTFGGYALAERTGRIPTLPIAVDLLRRTPARSVQFVDGEALAENRWRLRVQFCETGPSDGLVSVDVAENRWLNDTGLYPHQE
ncbi:hypothetical protein [Haloferax sp. YSMS24]|uniref:DUF7551 domain-containing protein n=1 Tax=Haloferax sp. YSMS24 TaxID=3388425 RepID=UPI00398D56D7